MPSIPNNIYTKLTEINCEEVAARLGLTVKNHKCNCFMHDDRHPSLSFCKPFTFRKAILIGFTTFASVTKFMIMDASKDYYESVMCDFKTYGRGRSLEHYCRDETVDYKWILPA